MKMQKKIKVLYLTHVTDLSGANSSLLQMITELRDNHDVIPFVIYPKRNTNGRKTIGDALKERGIEGKACGRMVCFQREHVGLAYKIYFVLSEILNLCQIMWLCRGYNFDLVHSNTSILDLGLYTSLLLRKPHIWHLREVAWRSFGFKSVLGDKYMSWLYRNSTANIAISKNVLEEFCKYTPTTNTHIIYNGVLPPVDIIVPNHIHNFTNICIVGRVEPNKNQLEAIKAVNILTNDGYKNLKLYVIGNYENEYGHMALDYVKNYGLTEYVVFMGVQNNVSQMLRKMNIGLMLSKHEAFGRVTIEYMQHGLFTISSNTSANVEIVHHMQNGFLYDFGDPKSLAQTIRLVIDNSEEYYPIAKEGLRDATHNYSSLKNSEKIYDLYQSVLS